MEPSSNANYSATTTRRSNRAARRGRYVERLSTSVSALRAPEMVDCRRDPALCATSELAPQSHLDSAAATTPRHGREFPGTAGRKHIGGDHGLADRSGLLPLVAAPLPDATEWRSKALSHFGEVCSAIVQLEVLRLRVRPYPDPLLGEVGGRGEHLLGRRKGLRGHRDVQHARDRNPMTSVEAIGELGYRERLEGEIAYDPPDADA